MKNKFSLCRDGYLKLVAMSFVAFFWLAGAWIVSLVITYLYGWLVFYDKNNFVNRKFCCLAPVFLVYMGIAITTLLEIKGNVSLAANVLGLFVVLGLGKCFKEANDSQMSTYERKSEE